MHTNAPRTFLGITILSLGLTGCLGLSVPTQSNPSCSWEKDVPANADAVCHAVFHTVTRLAAAAKTGDEATIRRLVSNKKVRRAISTYGAGLRRQRLSDYHVVPSITIDLPIHGVVGANFDIRAKRSGGTPYKNSETLYFHIHHGVAYVFDDQAEQDW